jgi:ankyrin repeat protein
MTVICMSGIGYLKANEIRQFENMRVLVDQNDSRGQTALSLAAENGHVEVVTMLLKVQANIEVQDKYGQAPLIYATENGHVDVVNVLLKAQANIEVQDEYGRAPLIYAA